jgi:hypothetical protein
MVTKEHEHLLTQDEAAEFTRISPRTFEWWRRRDLLLGLSIGPPYIKIGRFIRYRLRDLLGWISQHERSDAPPCKPKTEI